MLRTSALLAALATLALPLAACTSSVADTASLTLDNNDGSIQLILDRADPDHQFGTLSATINGVALEAPSIAPGGCTSDGAFFNGGNECHDADAIYQLPSAGLGATAADVTVTEDGETFQLVAPDFFNPRAIAVETPLDTPLVAGGTVAVTDGVAGDELDGWLTAATPTTSCFTLTGTGSGSLSFAIDAADFEAQCGNVAPGTIVTAEMNLTLSVLPAQTTCDGPDNLTCNVTELELEETIPVELQF